MDGWFDDPFFDRSAHPAGDLHSHFASMERRMSDMMGSMFSGFGFDEPMRGRLEDNHTTRSRARVEEVDENTKASEPRSGPIVEEPDDEPAGGRSHNRGESGAPQTFFYSSCTTSYTGSDGVAHAKQKTYNSATGKTEMAEMRKLGDKAVAVKREIDADGHVSEKVAHQNLDSKELSEFNRKWNKRQTPSITNSSASSKPAKTQARHRALK
jgi:hypothetical protein